MQGEQKARKTIGLSGEDNGGSARKRRKKPFFFLKLVRCYGEAGCGGLARNSRAEACARLEHYRGASSEAPLRDYVMPGAICWLGAERQRPWSCYTCD